MKKFLVLIACLCLVSSVYAAPYFSGGGSGGGTSIVYDTKANLPGAPTAGDLAGVNDGNTASDCTAGGGAFWNLCVYNGAAWVIQGDGTGASGSGSVTTIEVGNTQVGDTDIVAIDFLAGFMVEEAPDTETNVSINTVPDSGSATIEIGTSTAAGKAGSVEVKYDPTDFQESTNGLYLGVAPTITGDLALGAAPASTGAGVGDLLMSNATGIYFEAAPAATDIAAIVVDSAELLTIGGSGSSGVTITPATTITGALTLSSTFTDGVLTGDGTGGITGLTNLNSVVAAELSQLETIGATTISAAQWTGLGGATTAGIALWDDADNVAQLVTLGVNATASEINTPLDGATVTLVEFQQLEAIGATTVSAAQWTGLGGATTAGIALWDDADNVAQLVTLGVTATASEINTPLDGATVTLVEFQQLEAIGATTISAAQWTGLGGATTAGIALWDDATAAAQLTTLGIVPVAATINAIDDGAVTEILVGGGAGVVPAWGTDIPTAVTIGSAYIYRVGGTDVADADVVDTITASNYLPLGGGTLTAEVTVDDLGLEFSEGDTISDCSNFAATGGGIFYDDSDGKFKKCQDNVLTDLDTDTGGAPALSAVTAPTAAWSVAFDDEEKVTWTTSQNTAGSFFTINNSVADVTGQVYLLDLDYSVDDNQALADYIIAQDAGGTVFTLSQNGDILTTGSVSVGTTLNPDADGGASLGTVNTLEWQNLFMNTGAVINFENSDVTLTHSANTLTLAGGALDLTSGGITNAGNIADDAAFSVISASGAVTVESVVFTAGVITGSTSLTDGTATLTGGALTGLTTPLTVAQGGTGATSNTPTNVTPVDTGEEAAEFYFLIADGATTDQAVETDAAITYNPNTDTLTIVNLDVLGAPLPADPGADRVLTWDDSETGAELVWGTGGSGDVLADGSVPFTGNVTITNADPALTLTDSTSADGTATLSFQATGANEMVASLQTDVAGTPTTYIELDGITATVDVIPNLAIGANPADAGTGIRMSNNTVIEFEDTEGTGEVTALQVDAAEAILIGDANASGVTITPALTLSSTLTDGTAILNSGAWSAITTLAVTDAISLSDGAAIDQSANNLVEITENSDSIGFGFAGTDLDLLWSDGALNLRNSEDGVNAIVEIEGKDAGERGELRVLSDGDDKYIAAYHDDTDGWLAASSGDIIIAPDGDVDDYVHISTATNVTSISVVGGTGTLGTAAAEWQDIYLGADGTIFFGAGQETNIEFDDATGVVLTGDLNVSGTLTVTTFDQNAVATPTWLAQDSTATAVGTFDLKVDSLTATYDSQMRFYVDDSAGEDTLYMTVDGSAEDVDFVKIITANGGISTLNGATTGGFVDFYEDSTDGTNRVKVIAPAMASNYTLTLPNTGGTDGFVLKTDGSGTTSWTTAGSATAWDDLNPPDTDETLSMAGYTTQWTWTETSADMFTIFADGAFGNFSVMRIEQQTGDPTDGELLSLAVADAEDNVDQLALFNGTDESMLLRLVEAGTLTNTLASTDGFAQWIYSTVEDGTGATDTDGIFEIQTNTTMDADQDIFNVVKGTTTLFSVDEDGDVSFAGAFTDGNLTGDGAGGITGIVNLNSVVAAELSQLETVGATTISAAQWTGLGGATTAGIALWDDATAAAQLTTLGIVPVAATINAIDDGATTEILVGGGAGVVPVWTTATGTGAPMRGTSPEVTTGLELNHASQNTLTASGGVLSIEGNVVHHTGGADIAYGDLTGSIPSLTPVTDTAANFAGNFTGANLYGGTFVCNVTGSAQLPAPVAGMNFTIITFGAIAVTLLPTAGDDFILDGVQLDDNHDALNASTAGDIAVVQYYDADGWLVTTNGWTEVAD